MKKMRFLSPIITGMIFIGLFLVSQFVKPKTRIQSGDNQPLIGNVRPISEAGSLQSNSFSFFIVADIRNYAGLGTYDSSQYFRGAAEDIASFGFDSFIITPGDMDPTQGVYWTITQTLGMNYTWYPVIGNHELPGFSNETNHGENLRWLQSFDYGAVNPGPEGCPKTSYSFDYQSAHFVMLNEYCDENGPDNRDGDISNHIYTWLESDLNNTAQPIVIVIGHEPAFPQPDNDNGRIRHLGDSLDKYSDNRDRFWDLLKEQRVLAYICGHTHNYSIINIGGVWQIDAGHARGLGDIGAPSTYVRIHVSSSSVWFETFRDNTQGGSYQRRHSGFLLVSKNNYFPLIINDYTNSKFQE
jgi:hypothetical protein